MQYPIDLQYYQLGSKRVQRIELGVIGKFTDDWSVLLHKPVTRGTRVASFFWVQSLVRDDSRRRLLFELDTWIQTLTGSSVDADALLQLSGVYHNLLRRWVET